VQGRDFGLWNGGQFSGENSFEQVHAPLRLTHICNRNVKRKKVDGCRQIFAGRGHQRRLGVRCNVVVEVMGGLTPAGLDSEALRSGKSVVTANKQLIARSGPELIALARR